MKGGGTERRVVEGRNLVFIKLPESKDLACLSHL